MNFPQPPAQNSDVPDDVSASAPEQPNSAAREFNLFLDREGLRPIWGIALFLLLWELLRQFLFPLSQAIFPSPPVRGFISARHLYVFESAALLCVCIATSLMARLDSRAVATYGFALQHGLRNFLLGAATGAILLSALVAMLRASGTLVFDARLLFGHRIERDALVWAGGFLLVALAEELLLRGYLQFTLARLADSIFSRLLSPQRTKRASFWSAAIFLSIAFGGIHRDNPGESPLGLVNAALVGLVFCLSLWRTGSLWWAIGFHAAWDWAQSFLYGVADSGLMMQGRLFAVHPSGGPLFSGGLTGPEGSIFLLPILLAACAAIFLTLPGVPATSEPVTAPVAALDLP